MLVDALALTAAFAMLGTPDAWTDEPDSQAIVGGRPTEGNEFDAVVAILTGGGLCTGTLVAPDLVLTAAHCFTAQPDLSTVRVFQGADINTGVSVGATGYGMHPEFCDTCEADIHDYAYVTLEPGLTAVPIPPIVDEDEWNEAIAVGEDVTVVGYGADTSVTAEGQGLGQKRRVTTQITSRTKLGFEFFAGGGGKDSCEGDSGGPAFTKLGNGAWRLAGIVSRGSDPCGQGGFYGVPYIALPWVATASGTNLCPSTCSACDCIETAPPKKDEGCAVDRDRDGWGSLALFGALGLLGFRTRRRRTTTRRALR